MAAELIKRANAYYTGGNIYIYLAETTDGRFIYTADLNGDEEAWIEYFDTDVFKCDDEQLTDWDWAEEHKTEAVSDIKMWNEMLTWVINNKPSGNYSVNELTDRLISMDISEE